MASDEYWQTVLGGEDRSLDLMSRFLRRLPAAPRCKLCQAPFKGPFAPVLKMVGFGRWPLNPQMCRFCIRSLPKTRGGAEIPVSLLFADVRGSTTLAETMPPAAFREALDRFFALVTAAVDAEAGVVDHIVGDGVMAMWIPGFVGEHHAHHAVAAGLALATALSDDADRQGAFPAGVGVHTGLAYVGVVGEEPSLDFSVMGDAPNTAARLGSLAGAGELLLSDEAVAAAGVDTGGMHHRTVELRGKSAPLGVWALPGA